jgi:hypothetical protein
MSVGLVIQNVYGSSFGNIEEEISEDIESIDSEDFNNGGGVHISLL